jgi:hypothetical protein|uniref:Uncharacterized protein n=1 Tax=Zea mays TaxID=4577 RepID=B6SQC1_MAIZE|nr:hypothetical protein [Zea mays]
MDRRERSEIREHRDRSDDRDRHRDDRDRRRSHDSERYLVICAACFSIFSSALMI